MSMNKRSTKKYLINPAFQFSVIRYFVFLFLILAAANFASVFYFFYKFKNQGLAVGLSSQHVFFRFIESQEQSMYFLMGGAILVSLIVLVLGGFVLSHKVAGPLYRLTQHMKRHNEEDKELSDVKFRKGDYFIEIQDEFNRLAERERRDSKSGTH
jgi:sensor histidine kinase YesM